VSSHSENNHDEKGTKRSSVIIRHFELPPSRRKTICCPTRKAEELAVLWQRNPIVKAVNDGLSLHYSIAQILKLYPSSQHDALLWLMSTDLIGGSIGAFIGRHAIMHPNQPMTTAIRVWEATTDGAVAFVFTLGDAIRVYLTIYPEDKSISDLQFWGELMPIPLFFFFFYTAWHAVSPELKERIFPRNPRLNSMVNVSIDNFLRFAFFSRVWELFLHNTFTMPTQLPYQLIPCIPALFFTALIHYSPRYRERAKTTMVYMMAINLCYLLGVELVNDLGKQDEYALVSGYSRLFFWLSLLITSIYFTIKNTVRFVDEYQGTPELITEVMSEEEHLSRMDNNTLYLPLIEFNKIMGSDDHTNTNQQNNTTPQNSFSSATVTQNYSIDKFIKLKNALQAQKSSAEQPLFSPTKSSSSRQASLTFSTGGGGKKKQPLLHATSYRYYSKPDSPDSSSSSSSSSSPSKHHTSVSIKPMDDEEHQGLPAPRRNTALL